MIGLVAHTAEVLNKLSPGRGDELLAFVEHSYWLERKVNSLRHENLMLRAVKARAKIPRRKK